MTLTTTTDIRDQLHGVSNQGRRPTCLAFVASDVHRHARLHPEALCVEWLFYHVCQQAGSGPHEGTTIPDTRAVLHALGQPEEWVWPYSQQPPNPSSWRPPVATGPLLTSASSGCGAGLHTVRQRLEQNVPVAIGMFVSDTFKFPDTWDYAGNEVILGADIGQPVDQRRGHAVIVVGQGDYGGEPVMLLRNSWGPNWGHNGHAWVRESYLGPRLAGAFVISKGDSDVLQSDGRYADAHTSARLG
ncbi:C1 family peptidase [Marivita sp. S0852]|uniref:C1 family peptidase n=1 Tax=Marivita sp. S0852 TaxID=3373893 RepID=UPI003981DB72